MDEEGRKRVGGILLISFIILSILFFVVTAYIFHSADVSETHRYNPEWFSEYSNAKPPPPIPVIQPEIPNESILKETIFEVRGRVPRLAWRMRVLDEYDYERGWVQRNDTQKRYVENAGGDTSFVVRTPVLPTTIFRNYTLITLWDNVEGVMCSDFYGYNSTITGYELEVNIEELSKDLYVNVIAESMGGLGIMYRVYYTQRDMLILAHASASISDTKAFASSDPILGNFTGVPNNVTSDPDFTALLNSVRLGDEASVYEQVRMITNYLFAYFQVKEDIISEDPVLDFIRNQGGSILSFSYTVAVLLRALGIPTRVIVGFVGGIYDENTGYTKIRPIDSWVWIEVWDANNGWLPYEVVPSSSGAENLVPIASIDISAPRYIDDVPAVYPNETFTITVSVYGVGVDYYSPSDIFTYDLNESVILDYGYIETPDVETLRVSFQINYTSVYASIGKPIMFGVHTILIRIGAIELFLNVAVVMRSVIRVLVASS